MEPPKPRSGAPTIPAPVQDGGPERRRQLRVPLRVLRVSAQHQGEFFFGYASNISNTGVFIETSNPKPNGTRVKLKFSLPGLVAPTVCVAEVVWTREFTGKGVESPGMGLRFLELQPEAAVLIREFVEKE